MGFRFDLTTANWIATVLEPGAPVPPLSGSGEQFERLANFLDTFGERYYSSPSNVEELGGVTRRMAGTLRESGGSSEVIADAIGELRAFFRHTPWTALIVPSGEDMELDAFLCSPQFLHELIRPSPDFPGVVLRAIASNLDQVLL